MADNSRSESNFCVTSYSMKLKYAYHDLKILLPEVEVPSPTNIKLANQTLIEIQSSLSKYVRTMPA